jgi:hypothetical protein
MYECIFVQRKTKKHNIMTTTAKFKVTAKAPTVYQFRSLGHFFLNITEGCGSFYGEKIFNTKKDAEQHLIECAERYYDEYEGQVDEHIDEIKKYGTLTIDAVSAGIEEVEPQEEEEA